MEPRNSFTYALTAPQQTYLVELLHQGNYRPAVVPYSIAAADGDQCRIVLYTSGKCVVQGKGAQDFVTFVLEPQILQTVGLGYEDILNPLATAPHMGVDESGKGDFFGPLAIAGAYVDEQLAVKMRELDVRDSKRIGSDAKALEIARELRKFLGGRFTTVVIGPAKYNELYAKIKNVNSILAWGHARVIENLLEQVPTCPRAISDQFGSKEQVKRALMQKGRKIELEQRHKAESDLAVAAASILAREAFLMGLRRLGEQFQVKLPKGASDAVKQVAKELVVKNGPTTLLQVAKCHFRTTDSVLEGAGSNRAALGPIGAAQSRLVDRSSFHSHSKPTHAG